MQSECLFLPSGTLFFGSYVAITFPLILFLYIFSFYIFSQFVHDAIIAAVFLDIFFFFLSFWLLLLLFNPECVLYTFHQFALAQCLVRLTKCNLLSLIDTVNINKHLFILFPFFFLCCFHTNSKIDP